MTENQFAADEDDAQPLCLFHKNTKKGHKNRQNWKLPVEGAYGILNV